MSFFIKKKFFLNLKIVGVKNLDKISYSNPSSSILLQNNTNLNLERVKELELKKIVLDYYIIMLRKI